MLRRFFSTLPGKVVPSKKIKTQTPEFKSRIEKELFDILPEAWISQRVPNAQKFVTGAVLGVLYGGGIAANYCDYTNNSLSRDIINGEIHVLSSYLAFTCGMRAAIMHYLGCGIVPRRFYWAPHYMQISSVSGVLAGAFASGNSDVAQRKVLSILGVCFILSAGNEVLAARFNMSPKWLKMHSARTSAATILGKNGIATIGCFNIEMDYNISHIPGQECHC